MDIIKLADKNKDFVTADDGFVYYWPEGMNGCLSAHHLRQLADELDRRNKEWNDKIDEYFEKNKK